VTSSTAARRWAPRQIPGSTTSADRPYPGHWPGGYGGCPAWIPEVPVFHLARQTANFPSLTSNGREFALRVGFNVPRLRLHAVQPKAAAPRYAGDRKYAKVRTAPIGKSTDDINEYTVSAQPDTNRHRPPDQSQAILRPAPSHGQCAHIAGAVSPARDSSRQRLGVSGWLGNGL
jgi:hypothetical protein